jgi:predicted RNA polymerase sigma factor
MGPRLMCLMALMRRRKTSSYFTWRALAGVVDDEGVFLALQQQDRTRWDQQLIALGFRYLDASHQRATASLPSRSCNRRRALVARQVWPKQTGRGSLNSTICLRLRRPPPSLD